mgnify:CR=1 FL=1
MLKVPLFSETEQNMGGIASVDGSRKRKVRFQSKNESVISRPKSVIYFKCRGAYGSIQISMLPESELKISR